MNQAEYREQCTVVRWWELQHPKHASNLIASANGVKISGTQLQRAKAWNRLKLSGAKAGVSDLFIAVPVGGYAGLWLEMKADGKSYKDVTATQREHLRLMENSGYAATWAAGADSAIDIITKYMVGTYGM